MGTTCIFVSKLVTTQNFNSRLGCLRAHQGTTYHGRGSHGNEHNCEETKLHGGLMEMMG